jgi:hypothetical protein
VGDNHGASAQFCSLHSRDKQDNNAIANKSQYEITESLEPRKEKDGSDFHFFLYFMTLHAMPYEDWIRLLLTGPTHSWRDGRDRGFEIPWRSECLSGNPGLHAASALHAKPTREKSTPSTPAVRRGKDRWRLGVVRDRGTRLELQDQTAHEGGAFVLSASISFEARLKEACDNRGLDQFR